MRQLRFAIAAAALAAGLVGLAPAAAAQQGPPTGGGSQGLSNGQPPDFTGSGSGSTGSTGSTGGTILPGSSATHCSAGGHYGPIVHVPPPLPQEHYFANAEQYYAPAAGTQGTWWMRLCGGVEDHIVFVPGAVDPNAQVFADLVELSVEDPDIEMSPDEAGRQLVGLETWLWIGQWRGISKGDGNDVPGIDIRIDARPEKVVWDLGDGSAPITCGAGGTPYDPDRPADEQSTSCSHVFRRSSASRPNGRFTVSATVHWSATVFLNGQPLPEVQTAEKTSTLQIRVGERQALNRTSRRT
jgi:hypothetical protein